jgi:L-2,4-diaminobutyric acid acetyltransferase
LSFAVTESSARDGGVGKRAPVLRAPTIQDGLGVKQLISTCPPLDLNSTYCYLILCEHFAETSVVAEMSGEIVGVITGYRTPQNPQILFVWQVAVNPKYRGNGLGNRMLQSLWDRLVPEGVSEINTTVAPANLPSLSLFESFAKSNSAYLKKTKFIDSSFFGNESHENEDLISIKTR